MNLETQNFETYLGTILEKSEKYLKKEFNDNELEEFIDRITYLDNKDLNRDEIIDKFSKKYEEYVKELYQEETTPNRNDKLMNFLNNDETNLNLIWGDAYKVLRQMDSESVQLMVTSPPYYNAREYSQYEDLNEYLSKMKKILKECYRVLDNHRVFVFNIGDVFGNDNLTTKSVWGKRRLPLGAYFIELFEEIGFEFVDDIIWDKGEVQSNRHKTKSKPYPMYVRPVNSYEHILIFHKHRLDKTRYPCPICGCLKVNGNTQSEIGVQSWECKNYDCFERSESNRGKRFSLKSNMMQRNQTKENEIDEKLINKWRKDIVSFPPVIKINSNGKNVLGHTAPFPKDIPEMAVNFFTYKGEKVLDPFAGSFTTAIVAQEYGRKGIGIEINKDEFQEAIEKRIANEVNDWNKVKEYDVVKNKTSSFKGPEEITLDKFDK